MKTHEQYELELFEKEIDFIPLEKYILGKTKILHECINGHRFYESPTNILRGRGCLECSPRSSTKRKSIDEHIKELANKNTNFLLKDGQQYTNNKIPLVYICSNGHELTFRPTDVLKGYGCIHCVPRGRYTHKFFEKNPEEGNKSGILYVIRLTQYDSSKHIKVGVTRGNTILDLNKRIIKYNKYNPELLYSCRASLLGVFQLEQEVLTSFNKYRYVNNFKFSGHTELLDNSIELDILSYLKDKDLEEVIE